MPVRTFAVFEREASAKDVIPLLGRVVKNPRRPLDGFIPRIVAEVKNSKPKAEMEEQKEVTGTALPGTDVSGSETTSTTDFLEGYQFEEVVKKDKITADNIKSVGAKAGLKKIFNFDAGAESSETFELESDTIRTLSLGQHDDILEDLKQHLGSDLEDMILKAPGKTVWMMVSLKSADTARIDRTNEGGLNGSTSITIPVSESAGGVPGIGNPELSSHIKLSRSSAINGTTKMEVAFAAEYCQIVRDSERRFSIKRGVEKVQLAVKSKGVYNFSGKGLAFAGEEEDDEDDEFGDDGEIVYV
jgi:hypothetical protein